MRWLLALLPLLPAPVAALEYCDELWFTRNLVFARAGYCFGSPLGQAVFGTANCVTKSPELAPDGKTLVERIRALESQEQCSVDTKGSQLWIEAPSLRSQMSTLPVPTPYESSCVGWLGSEVVLQSGAYQGAPIVSVVQFGDNIVWSFENEGDWQYLTARRDGQVVGAGWTEYEITPDRCSMMAG